MFWSFYKGSSWLSEKRGKKIFLWQIFCVYILVHQGVERVKIWSGHKG